MQRHTTLCPTTPATPMERERRPPTAGTPTAGTYLSQRGRPRRCDVRQGALRLCRSAKRLCRRLDVCWTFVFFLLLVLVSVITIPITQHFILRSLRDSLHALHSTRVATVLDEVANVNERARYIANAYYAIHLLQPTKVNSPASVSSLCSTIDHFGDARFNRLFLYTLHDLEVAGCVKGSLDSASPTQLGGYYSQNHVINSTDLVNGTTYTMVQPRHVLAQWPLERADVSLTMPVLYGSAPIIKLAPGYYNGTITSFDPQLLWLTLPSMPHLLFYFIPVGVVARGVPLQPGQYADDFMLVGYDGTVRLGHQARRAAGLSVAAFAKDSLSLKDKLIYFNNWGQQPVVVINMFSPSLNTSAMLIPTQNVSDPLMRAALKHVNYTAFRTTGYSRSVDFEYKGAYATVTATFKATAGGLAIPLVIVSAQSFITLPYLLILRICIGITAVAIVLFTALFWWFVHNEYSRPLEDMTLLLFEHVKVGKRTLYRTAQRTLIQLSESAQLIRAFNECMRRLREIDAFVPRDVRRRFWLLRGQDPTTTTTTTSTTTDMSRQESSVFVEMRSRLPSRHSDTLRPHHVTMAHVTVRAWTAHAEAAAAAAAAVAGGDAVALHGGGARRGQRLAAVVERAAHAGGVANSGAFASAAAVAAFSAAVHELAAQHGGLVRNLTPDGCVVHFMAAVCAHLPRHGGAERGGGPEYDPAPLRACIDADAYAGLAFALALQRWVDARSGADTAGTAAAAAAMPDVRCLVDTGVYTCGQYRAPGSEQTLTVALGRDAQRVVGRAAALLGVRVAMTEETAVRVRPGPRAATEPGVRQLPVEALRTGRAGLDADAVILYEVLPGAAAGDAAWLAYARCCFDGFECMVRGDYAGALRAYRGVGEIGDLEPGLLPRCLSREAAHSDAVGGAVSVQVQRMMRECERRVAARVSSGYCRERRSPYGIDAVLRAMPLEQRMVAGHFDGVREGEYVKAHVERRQSKRLAKALSVLMTPDTVRYIGVVPTLAGDVRCVLGTKPEMVIDNVGTAWYMSRSSLEKAPMEPYNYHFVTLGSAGSICIASFLPFREMQPMLTKAIANASRGPMSAALRSAVPVHDATAKQRRAIDELFLGRRRLNHPHLLGFNAYSLSVEGGVAVMKNFAPGGTLREVLNRYSAMSERTLAGFALGILSGLSYLHAKGCVHGALSLDNVVVGADGQCRLRGYFTDHALADATFLLPCTCYVSPAKAAGHAPTPACDMFCYGLLWLEGLTGRKPWMWAADENGNSHGTADELDALINGGGSRFRAAVAMGRVIPALTNLERPSLIKKMSDTNVPLLSACLSLNAAVRPTAEYQFVAVRELINDDGVYVEAK